MRSTHISCEIKIPTLLGRNCCSWWKNKPSMLQSAWHGDHFVRCFPQESKKGLECTPCGKGSVAESGGDTCMPCRAGRAPSGDAVRCELCPAGKATLPACSSVMHSGHTLADKVQIKHGGLSLTPQAFSCSSQSCNPSLVLAV